MATPPNNIFEMTFADFAESVRPTGAINRFPAIAPAADVYSYSVYLNGPVAKGLSLDAQEHTYKDVMVYALTEKLQLNPLNARDNLKVAELVALRFSWMSAVLESSIGQGVQSGAVIDDYTMLTKGMTHPWIVAELDKQRELSRKLGSTLTRAGVAMDVIPRETSLGVVVAQDFDFTIQQTKEGEVVTHENRRLQELPKLGEDVMVTYYRGTGQVVQSLEKATISDAFIDPETEDLAVSVADDKGNKQIIRFNGMISFDRFVKAHDLDIDMVQRAMDVRAASPKSINALPLRKLVKSPYIDLGSGCLAVDYMEKESTYTAMFPSAEIMASLAKEFDLGAKAIAMGYSLEEQQNKTKPLASLSSIGAEASEMTLRGIIHQKGYESIEASGPSDKQYLGKVVAASAMHVAQETGRKNIVIHDVRTLDKTPSINDQLSVKFKNGRGVVTELVKPGQDLGR
ncbi:MAG: hypothetical protein V4713_12300 [Pseudomonadota bacterium]